MCKQLFYVEVSSEGNGKDFNQPASQTAQEKLLLLRKELNTSTDRDEIDSLTCCTYKHLLIKNIIYIYIIYKYYKVNVKFR